MKIGSILAASPWGASMKKRWTRGSVAARRLSCSLQ